MAEHGHQLARVLVGLSLLGFIATGVIVLPVSRGWPDALTGGGSQRPFAAAAAASGGYVQYGIPGQLPMEQAIDGGGPVAQAFGDSFGARNAFASLPYPGPTAITVPGVANSFTGLPTPAYPFYAHASYPTEPEGKISDPGGAYSLAAAAKESSAVGEARFGAPGGQPVRSGSSAHSEVAATPEAVSATASSLNEGVSMGPLSAAVVRSLSKTTYSGAGSPVTQSELVIEGGRVGDVTFSLAPDGLRFGGAGAPVPVAEGLARMNQAFAPSGLSAKFLEPQPIPGGVIAGIFEVVSVAEVPGAGKGTLRLRLGGAISAISLGDEPEPKTRAGSDDSGATPDALDARSELRSESPASQLAGPSLTQPADRSWTQALVGEAPDSSGDASTYGKTAMSEPGLTGVPGTTSDFDSAAPLEPVSAPELRPGAIRTGGVGTLAPARALGAAEDVGGARTLAVLLAGMGGLLGFLLLFGAQRKRCAG